jgi:hypothetical protein
MPRPATITEEDILRWSSNINNDPNLPKDIINIPIVKELCFAGLFLCEQLESLSCPQDLIMRIQFSAGAASFGNDPWDVHLKFLNDYQNNLLNIETDDILN